MDILCHGKGSDVAERITSNDDRDFLFEIDGAFENQFVR